MILTSSGWLIKTKSVDVKIHVKIHLNHLLDLSKGPMQARQIPSKGLCDVGKCLLSYFVICMTAYHAAIHVLIDSFSHSSEPK